MGHLRSRSLKQNRAVEEDNPSSSSSFSSLFQSNSTAIGAEEAARAIISLLQPTVVSERRRNAVIDYLKRLLRRSLRCEVFPFGSGPLKTYLPDGDIDLAAFGGSTVEEAMANAVWVALKREEHNRAAEFAVENVQLIRAEVKIVKCFVQRIAVDISFNQLGGLCTLCFLEKIDRHIGKDHLFKHSIILIKAWCYYESRILGGHHGLMTTYALETLVLYIFHFFHSTLNGPLEVLYKFLDYFSKFDWERYCISLNGPIRISLLPALVAEAPENGGGDLLLSADFLNSCVEMFSVPPSGYDANSRAFIIKPLNIFDPLKENNNLGRSISLASFYRIRGAFNHAARRLRNLFHDEENVVNAVHKFFCNTLGWHGGRLQPDVQNPHTLDRHGDEIDLASVRIECLTISHDAHKSSPSSFEEEGISPLGHQSHRASHLCFSSPIMENGEVKDNNTNKCIPENSDLLERNPSYQHLQSPTEATGSSAQGKQDENHVNDDDEVANKSETKQCSPPSNSVFLSSEAFDALSDLNGDYESHFNSFQTGRWYYDYAFSAALSPIPPPLPWQYPSKNPLAHINCNGFLARPAFYPIRSPILPGGATLGMDEIPKPRATGTYFPNMNHYRDRPPSARGRNQEPVRSPGNNGQPLTPLETTVPEKSGQDLYEIPTVDHAGGSPVRKANHNGNGAAMPWPDRAVEYWSFGHLQLESPTDCKGEPSPVPALFQNSAAAALNVSSPKNQKAKETLITDQDRLSVHMQSYELKDEEDFPPLSN